ncbi:hypothetical protein K435DRAFT_219488 [Dendrothele bispora CBS 962.96]|uniref:Uncharacterized protein n=1 Tax=Dendrothele bispora (strain CBS 962.96) TaxID=1314807 RepID=A0A4S8LR89_DENBC|nr:hypothetical protein K435DRAFT_219488 [Dendrothele bispora CBS 962.96]
MVRVKKVHVAPKWIYFVILEPVLRTCANHVAAFTRMLRLSPPLIGVTIAGSPCTSVLACPGLLSPFVPLGILRFCASLNHCMSSQRSFYPARFPPRPTPSAFIVQACSYFFSSAGAPLAISSICCLPSHFLCCPYPALFGQDEIVLLLRSTIPHRALLQKKKPSPMTWTN